MCPQTFTDGFDCYSVIGDAILGYWDSAAAGNTLVAGRFAGSQAIRTAAAATLVKSSGQNDAVHHIHCAFQQTAAITGTTLGLYFQLSDAATNQVCIVFRSDGAILLTSATSGGTVLATYAGAVTAANTWYSFEFEVVIHPSAGSFKVRKNGNPSDDHSTTGINTRPGANAYANRLTQAKAGGVTNQDFDDFIWQSGASAGSWIGETRCRTRMPAGDAGVQWTPSAAAVPLTPFTQNTSSSSVNGTARYGPFTPTVTGTVATAVLTTNAGNTGNVKCTIFSDAAGKPGTVLGSANVMTNTVTGLVTFTFPSPVSVTAGTQYWIGWCPDTAVTNYFSVGASGTAGQSFGTTYAAFPTANPGSVANVPPVFTVYTVPTGVSGSNYGFVNEPTQDAANSYVYSSTVGQTDRYTIAPIDTTPATTFCVTTRALLQKSDAGTRNTSVLLKSGATEVATPSAALPAGSWAWQSRVDLVDPATGSAWTAVGVANAMIGVQVTA